MCRGYMFFLLSDIIQKKTEKNTTTHNNEPNEKILTVNVVGGYCEKKIFFCVCVCWLIETELFMFFN